ncbi:quinone-dependent dihydroorotate dehydrogenase [Aliiroseovarius crassostreae]|uniref:Dihydroorotate dehydrogenase (quinone) n=1 Tax=Aliiroseovarius crassostreae TaxID=154981 RepID=A0A9Q9LVP4_9RHOB|nr:quinone-dependent dihydroorotate dehydrogenase [Aliiroseovarius crassostreae]UWP92965.1 quinone-dependent dihydroorotate dehydrogenase [Aliiroseovarius crassostreae]UWP96106.1 quinone-dependent dihydroorotate dehydrogenase [Aliiroseovarius crassostreae]UWP99276.1 quinone-dependent dihydroorotate dehydrogenase [Aliiroseovarius crassostreae]
MNLVEKLALKALHQTDPERAHSLSLLALRAGVVPLAGDVTSDRLKTNFCGMDLLNPVGLAAGYDKNAQAVSQLTQAGFGFVEVGAITPRAQPGNPKPRLFRLTEDRAVINRFGFNNEGMDAAATRLARRDRRRPVPVGLNLGANKDSEDRAADFAKVLECCGPHLDFATVNVSSPNTEKLRDLQGADALRGLLSGVQEVRGGLDKYIPVFLKIAPDLSDAELAEIVEVALEVKIDAVIATNTTLSRDGLKSAHKGEMGGLSGAPLFEKSTRVLARLSKLSDGKLPLIGVGGISSAEQAYAKIRAGASVVQLYSALAYQGLSLVEEVARGLDTLLARDGFSKVSEAVGTGREDWL